MVRSLHTQLNTHGTLINSYMHRLDPNKRFKFAIRPMVIKIINISLKRTYCYNSTWSAIIIIMLKKKYSVMLA